MLGKIRLFRLLVLIRNVSGVELMFSVRVMCMLLMMIGIVFGSFICSSIWLGVMLMLVVVFFSVGEILCRFL